MLSRTGFRRVCVVALVVMAVLGGAACNPLPSRTLIGSSAKGGTATLEKLESKLGKRAQAHRVFNSGFRIDILNDSQVRDDRARGRTTVYSVKLNWARLTAGAYDRQIVQMARLLKADGRRIFLAFHHEPEDNGNPALFRAAFSRFAFAVKSVGARNVYVTNILMEWTFNPKSGRRASDWLPPKDTFDVFALDMYMNPQKTYRTFAQAVDKGYDVARWLNKKFGVAEWGVVARAGDRGYRARAIANGLKYAKANNFAFVCWFHSDIGQNSPPGGWYLDSNNDTAAVKAFANAL